MDTHSPAEALGPLISPEFLRLLRDAFPLQRPQIDTPDRVIWLSSGQQSILEFLEEAHANAHENNLRPEGH